MSPNFFWQIKAEWTEFYFSILVQCKMCYRKQLLVFCSRLTVNTHENPESTHTTDECARPTKLTNFQGRKDTCQYWPPLITW